MDAKAKCLFINDEIPKAKLFEAEKRDVHPDCNTSWRISPEPFWISETDLRWFEELGTHLLNFYRACNLLYSQSARGIQPPWVAEYLEIGKPEPVIQYGRMNRFKSQLPGVLRPDILPTGDGMAITELDSIPGFIGATGCLARLYAQLGYKIIGGSDGMVNGYADMIRNLAKKDNPTLAIVVSDESEDYRAEMMWLADALCEAGVETRTVKPHEVIFTEDGLLVESAEGKVAVDVIYRFYELFDLPNIPKAELMFYSAKKRNVVMTPPPKSYLEEKLCLALFHHPTLQPFWKRHLGKKNLSVPTTSNSRNLGYRCTSATTTCRDSQLGGRWKPCNGLAAAPHRDTETTGVGYQTLGFFRTRMGEPRRSDRTRSSYRGMGSRYRKQP